MLLDEPTSNLDEALRGDFTSLFEVYRVSVTVLMATSDLGLFQSSVRVLTLSDDILHGGIRGE